MELYTLEITTEEYNDISSDLKDWVICKKDKNYSIDNLITFLAASESRTQVGFAGFPGFAKYENHTYTNNTDEVFKITYIQESCLGLNKDYCVLGIKKLVVKED